MTPDRGHRQLEPHLTTHRGALRPRVVIFDTGNEASVEVVELPASTAVGSTIHHRNGSWQVVDERPHSRVLIAAPVGH